jgi:hypothetical protein
MGFLPCHFALYEIRLLILERTAGLAQQLLLFAESSRAPEGLRYAAEFISPATERDLIECVAALPLQPFQFGQYEGKRRVASFGFRAVYRRPIQSRHGSRR